MNADPRAIADWWLEVAEGSRPFPPEFSNLIALWESYNGWITLLYPRQAGNDAALRDKFAADQSMQKHFADLLAHAEYTALLDELRDMCPVKRVPPVEGKDNEVSISAPYKLDALMLVIY